MIQYHLLAVQFSHLTLYTYKTSIGKMLTLTQQGTPTQTYCAPHLACCALTPSFSSSKPLHLENVAQESNVHSRSKELPRSLGHSFIAVPLTPSLEYFPSLVVHSRPAFPACFSTRHNFVSSTRWPLSNWRSISSKPKRTIGELRTGRVRALSVCGTKSLPLAQCHRPSSSPAVAVPTGVLYRPRY